MTVRLAAGSEATWTVPSIDAKTSDATKATKTAHAFAAWASRSSIGSCQPTFAIPSITWSTTKAYAQSVAMRTRGVVPKAATYAATVATAKKAPAC